MLVFPGMVNRPSNVTVDCLYDANAREHRRPVLFGDDISVSIAACHSSASCSALGSSVMYSAASQSVTSSFRPGNDRIEKPLIPRPRLFQSQRQLTIRTEVAVDERLYR